MKQYRNTIFAWIMLIGFFIPITITFVHSFEKHEHHFCTAKKVKHIHQSVDDCSNLHYFLHNISLVKYDFNLVFVVPVFSKIIQHFTFDYIATCVIKSSRAPPFL